MKTLVWGRIVPTGPASWTTEENYVAALSHPPMETVSPMKREVPERELWVLPTMLETLKAKLSRARKQLGSLAVG